MATTLDRMTGASEVMGIATYLAEAVLTETVTVADAAAALNDWLTPDVRNLEGQADVASGDAETLLDLAIQFVSGSRALVTATSVDSR